ncbi:MAG: hypothetical protein HXX08_25375 [Chloroflexi bacterium]|uniref:Uncharacterized protein n=1 Tax=Candidatus Chlorohelix allophototropha TaxID=3003348 RepID=A0A8T7MBE7_9CHLR|nr:hypothetical protein [Chloroflexota bacterium]WJW69049.1 hypothetical protein OZ401_002641 [Chloroflexota bacterium L227-S17]
MQEPSKVVDTQQVIHQPFTQEDAVELYRTLVEMLNQKAHLTEMRQKIFNLTAEQKTLFNIAVLTYNVKAEQLRSEGWSIPNLELLDENNW